MLITKTGIGKKVSKEEEKILSETDRGKEKKNALLSPALRYKGQGGGEKSSRRTRKEMVGQKRGPWEGVPFTKPRGKSSTRRAKSGKKSHLPGGGVGGGIDKKRLTGKKEGTLICTPRFREV